MCLYTLCTVFFLWARFKGVYLLLEPAAAAANILARCLETLAVHVTLLAPSMPRILINVGTFSLTNRGFCVC